LILVPEIQEGGLLSKASDWWLVGLIIFQLTTKTVIPIQRPNIFINLNIKLSFILAFTSNNRSR